MMRANLRLDNSVTVVDFCRQCCHAADMRGIGASRRHHHRGAVADEVRRLRRGHGWSQRQLGDKLGVDARQVARLEASQVPVTLELLDELARAFDIWPIHLVASALSSGLEEGLDNQEWLMRVARAEYQSVFGTSLRRPAIRRIVELAVDLPAKDLEILDQVAIGLYVNRAVTFGDVEFYSPKLQRILADGYGLFRPVREMAPATDWKTRRRLRPRRAP